jgi:hypothetical protein
MPTTDLWKRWLLVERHRELLGVMRACPGLRTQAVDVEFSSATSFLGGDHLDLAARCLDDAERALLAERCRRREEDVRYRAMGERLARWERRIPPIHPCGEDAVLDYLAGMRAAMHNDDPAEFERLAGKIRSRVAQELRFEAENYETFPGSAREAYKLRRQADRYEAMQL